MSNTSENKTIELTGSITVRELSERIKRQPH